MNDITFAYKSTQKALADALEVTVSDLINGGDKMKKTILHAEVIKAAESLAVALSKFSSDPMYCSVTVFTKDVTCKCEGDPEGIPDYYSVRIHDAEDVEGERTFISESARVYYGEDGIRTVLKF